MFTRVLYIGCSGKLWLGVVGRLLGRGWLPVYWTGAETFAEQARRLYPPVIYQGVMQACRGVAPPELAHLAPGAVDQPLLAELAFGETIALGMMDRMDPGGAFTLRERTRFYNSLLGFWLAALKELRPDLVVFPEPPHAVYDYVLYLVAKRLGVPTMMFPANTAFFHLALPVRHFEHGSPELQAAYQRNLAEMEGGRRDFPISAKSQAYLDRVCRDYRAAMPSYVRDRFAKERGEGWRGRLAKLATWPREKAREMSKPAPPNYLKQPNRSMAESRLSGAQWRQWQRQASRRLHVLRAQYDSLARPVDLEAPFVFVGLHYQPEQTTSPSGEAYANQDLMVRLLAGCLPEGWRVYVKDHPFQFMLPRGSQARDEEYYRMLAAWPKVSLVPLDVDPFQLIDRSRAVATVTGSVGWEAVCRGKPALLFGHVWYEGCEGTFNAASAEGCRQALAKVAAGYEVDQEKVHVFVHTMEQVCRVACSDADRARRGGLTMEENVESLSLAIAEFYAKMRTRETGS